MSIKDYLSKAIDVNASDLHITVGKPPVMRVDGELMPIGDNVLTPADTLEMVKEVLDPDRFADLEERGEYDFSYALSRFGRFRVNAYRQRGELRPCVPSRAQ